MSLKMLNNMLENNNSNNSYHDKQEQENRLPLIDYTDIISIKTVAKLHKIFVHH